MTHSTNLNAIAIDVVGHYGQAARNLVATYRAGTERALGALNARSGQIGRSLPWLTTEVKENLLGSQQRVSRLVVDAVERFARGATSAVARVQDRAVQGLEAFDEQTAWANDMMVVGALRRVNLPVARLSLRIAGGVDAASRRLSQRVAGATAVKARKTAKSAARRVRRAARAA